MRRLEFVVLCDPNREVKTLGDLGDDHIRVFSLPIDKDMVISEMMNNELSLGNGTAARKPVNARAFGEGLAGVDSNKAIHSIVLNFLLYMKMENREVRHANADEIEKIKAKEKKARKEKKAYKHLRKKINLLESDRTMIVGSTIRITGDKSMYGLGSGNGTSHIGEYTVRGHWRWQAHGKGRILRKRMWIKPHVRCRGDEGTAAVGHQYVL